MTIEAVYRCRHCRRRISEAEYENDVCSKCGKVGVYAEYYHVFGENADREE